MGAAVANEDASRCIGCGKPVEAGTTFRILVGVMRDGDFDEKSEYGDVHEDCFHRAVETPRSVLEAVRRKARKSGKRLRKV
jgi:hypothetical protein